MLDISRKLFESFHHHDLRYCQWKSNEHLQEALIGKTDLDVLVDEKMQDKCKNVLNHLGFKRVTSQYWARYDGLEDWIGFDEETGELIHLHLHFRMVTGNKFTKEQDLPWEELALDTARMHPIFPVKVIDPNLEIIVLHIRVMLKMQRWKYRRKRSIPKNIYDEIEYLNKLIEPNQFDYFLYRLFKHEDAELLRDIILNNKLDHESICVTKRLINRNYGQYKLSWIPELSKFTSRALIYFMTKIKEKANEPSAMKKAFKPEGKIIAFIGADGSGKSTVTEKLVDWLSWKTKIQYVYFGSGDGQTTFFLIALKNTWRFIKRFKKKARDSSKDSNNEQKKQTGMLMAIYQVMLAMDKLNKCKKVERWKLRGIVVIADRFPQIQYRGIQDGPSEIASGNKNVIVQFLNKWEQHIFEKINAYSPDMVIKLMVSQDVAEARKADHVPSTIKTKREITKSLAFANSQVVEIDADDPLDEVIRKSKMSVWKCLQ